MLLSLFKAGGAEIFPRRGQWRPEPSPWGHSSLPVRSAHAIPRPDCCSFQAQGRCPTFKLAQGGDAQFFFALLGCYATWNYPITDWVRILSQLSQQKANCWMMNKLSTKNVCREKMTGAAYRESIWTSANIHPSVSTDNLGQRNLQRKLQPLFQANHLQSLSTTVHWRIKSTAAKPYKLFSRVTFFPCLFLKLLLKQQLQQTSSQVPLETSVFFSTTLWVTLDFKRDAQN